MTLCSCCFYKRSTRQVCLNVTRVTRRIFPHLIPVFQWTFAYDYFPRPKPNRAEYVRSCLCSGALQSKTCHLNTIKPVCEICLLPMTLTYHPQTYSAYVGDIPLALTESTHNTYHSNIAATPKSTTNSTSINLPKEFQSSVSVFQAFLPTGDIFFIHNV